MPDILHLLARHLVVGIGGTELTDEEQRLLSAEPPAGVILFSRNVSSRSQLRDLTSRIHETAAESGRYSPLVMADHEGGRISVLSRALGAPPSQAAVARTGSLKLARLLYREIAEAMRSLGINVLLGPVADVNTEIMNPVIGTRSFGDDPARVAVLVRESVIEIQRAGVAACIKHFPGHGSTSGDSHLTLPVINRTPEQLKQLDRPPFGAGVWAGSGMVMMGHVVPPDGAGPATFESGIIAGTLREELGFDGVVVTDALEMAGAKLGPSGASERSLSEIVELSLSAGNDLLLFSRPVSEVYRQIEALGGPKGSFGAFWGQFPPTLATNSLRRIGALRSRFSFGPGRDADARGAGDDLARVSAEIARRSVSVLRDPRSVLGAGSRRIGSILFAGERADFENDVVRRFVARICGLFGIETGGLIPGDAPGLDELERLFERADQPDGSIEAYRAAPTGESGEGALRLLFLLNRRPLSESLVSRLSLKADIAVVSDWPYSADSMPGETAVIVTYGTYDAAAEAVEKAILTGRSGR